MDKDHATHRDMGNRNCGGNHYGVERRRSIHQGSYVMVTVYRWTFYGLLLLNLILSINVINLGFFAKQGPRYTADDGALERAERIQADKELTARIDALHPPHCEHE